MKRVRLLVTALLTVAALSLFAVAGTASADGSCTPNWHVVQSQNIYYGRDTIGVVNLLRDGCGDVQGTLQVQPGFHFDFTDVWLVAGGVTLDLGDTATPVYSGYGGVPVSAAAVLIKVNGDAGIINNGQTANDSGY